MKKPLLLILLPAALLLAFAFSCSKCPDDAKVSSKPHARDEHGDHDHADHDEHEEHTGGHAEEVTLTPDAVARYGIAIDIARPVTLEPTVLVPARVAFNTEAMAHVGCQLRGRVVAVNVRIGDAVTVGQELLIVESPELGEAQADLMLKRTAAESAGPATELAKLGWERAKGLYERSQGISLTEVQKREAEFKAAAASQRAAEAAVLAAQNRLRLLGMGPDQIESVLRSEEIQPRLAIRAPIDGLIVQREVTLGELVGPDRDSLLTIADVSTLWVLAEVPEAKLQGLLVGNKAWVTLGSRSQTTGSETKQPTFEGRVSFIAPLIDPVTRTTQVRIEVPADAHKLTVLKPGMFAQADISLRNSSDAPARVAVPTEAIQTIEGSPVIFVPVEDEPNTFAKRAVALGSPVGGRVPILSGLSEGEAFVARGTFILKAELGKNSAAHEH